MKKALVDTQTSVQHIVSWGINPETKQLQPNYDVYANSCRVCEVENTTFEVCPTLIWVDCNNDVLPDLFWYDSVSQVINPVVNEPAPEPVQPITSGTQDL